MRVHGWGLVHLHVAQLCQRARLLEQECLQASKEISWQHVLAALGFIRAECHSPPASRASLQHNNFCLQNSATGTVALHASSALHMHIYAHGKVFPCLTAPRAYLQNLAGPKALPPAGPARLE